MKPTPRKLACATRRLLALIASSGTALLVLTTAQAAPSTWTGATAGTWDTTTNWSTSTIPTSADDLTILGPSNVAGTITINIGAADAANSITFTNTSATTLTGITASQTLTLSSSGTAITTGTGAVTIGGGTGVNIALGASQTWDVGSGGLTASNVISGAFGLTKDGTGALTLNGANSFNGGFAINNGTVSISNNNGLGATGNVVTLGSGSNNTILLATGALSGVKGAITVAAGAGTRTITSTNNTAFGSNGVVFDSGGSITLNHDLIVADTASGNIQFRGVISGVSGLIMDSTNTGYIQLNAANTFNGGVAINGGNAVVGVSSAGSVGSITSGAFGTGAVTLGSTGSSTAATLGINGVFSVLNNLTVTSGGTRTLGMFSAGTTAGTYSGQITLNSDLTLTAVASTRTDGADRLRVGGGGITGSNNIIINNSNTATGLVAGSGSIRLLGSGTGTAWTGNLVVQAGQGSLGDATGIGSSNTVGVASGALFNFSDGAAINPTIAGLADAASGAVGGTTGGTVYHSQATNRTLTLGGSGTYTFDGVITNALNGTNTTAITKSGAGTQTLNGTNTYTGATAVSAGSLFVNGSITSAVSVSAGTFGGTGSSTATVTIGDSTGTADSFLTGGGATTVGTFTTTGAVAMNSDAVLALKFNSTLGTFDKIVASGLTLNAGTTLSLTDLVGSGSVAAGTYTIFDNTSVSSIGGTFASQAEGFTIIVGANTFTVSYTGGTGNDITLTVAAIPEPSTYAALAGLGVLALAFCRRRRAI